MSDPDKKTRMGTPAPAGSGNSVAVPNPTPAPSWGESTQAGDVKPLTQSAAPVYVAPADPLIGQALGGRYLIQKKLGEGGMGAVYLAQHTVLEKAVALKVLHGEFARKPDLVERFMQEARAASRIRHENVIDISDFGSTPDGMVFFAMELLQGHDLHEEIARARLAKTRLPWERSRKIFLQICAALSAAHGHGIIHRDLKPENIYLVEWLGHKDFVKLLDFGIAKLTEVGEGDRKLTRTGMLFGTPEYMSPEQARGENVDHRVDIYAMGCILHQLVTGKVPFEAENFMGILSLHLTEPPPTIDPAVLAEIGAPQEIAAIVTKALAKSRAERWETIDEMANAIRALHGEDAQPVNEPTVPRVQSQAPRSAPPVRTEWKGQVAVPTDDEPLPRPPPSKVPLLLGGVAVVAALAVGAVLVLGKGNGASAAPPAAGTATGTAVTPPTGPGTAAAVVEAALPARVTISLASNPAGAEIYDMTTKEVVGLTPFDFELPGARAPRRFTLRKDGFGGKMIELVPNEDVVYTVELKPLDGAAAPEPAVEVVPRGGKKPAGHGSGSAVAGSVTPPVTPDGPVTTPSAGTGKHRGSGSAGRGSNTTAGSGSATPAGGGSDGPVVKPPDDDPDLIPLKPVGGAGGP
ncbi:MAG: serine/threonine protein kinase [Myxococcales bacterium]|nr:serine/threonine protein kinase [Myxococcales bacterium]